ncbi:hypothetical protein HPB52_023370 [Rhipicephalus sanguineus]|uniref:Uncharacterized protein n=1 Tax=Rhipicephalus sanguineus TaxID=34632 RepID=A0A9D4QES4_RHISA|nr:hypothetical protein HPB52_023370 [Rhipicephalus sanguineus]
MCRGSGLTITHQPIVPHPKGELSPAGYRPGPDFSEECGGHLGQPAAQAMKPELPRHSERHSFRKIWKQKGYADGNEPLLEEIKDEEVQAVDSDLASHLQK